ncbi:MAG: ATP-binding cassette domain-containing protein [Paracoccaceae bacterium]|nr:ATP-binding cassette domain-containing protein [Paracoccaceae bacterium]
MTDYKITGVNLVIEKNSNVLLGPMSFELSNSNFIILLGQNGAGKTSLLRLLHGLDYPKSGSLTWEPLIKIEEQSFVFQSPVILRRNVLENVLYPLILKGVPRPTAILQAKDWLDKTSLTQKASEPALSLSGGERQRMVIARALISKPKILFLDEPTVNLDGESKLQIENLLKQAVSNDTKIIMATHDLGQAKRLGDVVLFLHNGKIIETSSVKTFFNKPQTVEALTFLRGDILR